MVPEPRGCRCSQAFCIACGSGELDMLTAEEPRAARTECTDGHAYLSVQARSNALSSVPTSSGHVVTMSHSDGRPSGPAAVIGLLPEEAIVGAADNDVDSATRRCGCW